MAFILLVDDEPQLLTVYGDFLRKEGHTVLTAPNGKVGMQLIAENDFDIIVTDLIMPERDGLEMLMSQKKAQKRPKVIAITGGSPAVDQDNLLTMAKMLGADLVLPKPIRLQRLSESVRQLCEG